MPRYRMKLTSSKHPRLLIVQLIYAPDEQAALTFTAGALRRKRATDPRGNAWDIWIVCKDVYPYGPPRLIASGQIRDD